MDATKIIIENWPKTNLFLTCIPIIVAIIALVVSLSSLYFTNKSFSISHRPYVWALSYAVPDPENKTLIQIPYRMGCFVNNSPAKIKKIELKINLDKETLFSLVEKNLVRFPLANSEWTVSIGQKDYENIMNRPEEEQAKLLRIVTMEYSALGGGKTYHYKQVQSFIPADNQWKDINE